MLLSVVSVQYPYRVVNVCMDVLFIRCNSNTVTLYRKGVGLKYMLMYKHDSYVYDKQRWTRKGLYIPRNVNTLCVKTQGMRIYNSTTWHVLCGYVYTLGLSYLTVSILVHVVLLHYFLRTYYTRYTRHQFITYTPFLRDSTISRDRNLQNGCQHCTSILANIYHIRLL